MISYRLAIVTLLTAMISIQSGAAVAKQLFPRVGAIGATTLRLTFATLILFAIRRPWKEKLNRDQIQSIVLYGASLGCMNLIFYMALERIPLGIAVALEFTGPLTLALAYSRRVLDFVWTIFAMVGIVLLLPLSQTLGNLDPLGVLFALVAGCFWALYIIFGQRAGASARGGTVTAWGMFVAALVVLPVGLFHSGTELFGLEILPIALVVGVLSSALPYSLEMVALKRLPAQTFSILMSIEPALGAILGLVSLKEYLTVTQWAAICCIIVASVGSSFSKKSTQSPSETPVLSNINRSSGSIFWAFLAKFHKKQVL